jgi:Fe-S cluster biogenesis protein NfuA
MQTSISVQPTPNPNALKFILENDVKVNGSSSYRSPDECKHNPLAESLFRIRGIDQVHFFQHVVTISKFGYADWDDIESNIISTIEEGLSSHDANYEDPNPEEERRRGLTQELRDIEAILDKTVRPGLQGDGGDLICLSYEDNILIIKYQGACGTCPSATQGTLYAIKSILQEQYDPKIEVYTAPEY